MHSLARRAPNQDGRAVKLPSPMISSLREACPKRKQGTDVDSLILKVREGSPVERWEACLDIHDMAQSDPKKAAAALPALTDAMDRWGAITRAVVADTLSAIGDGRALPALCRHAGERQEQARERIEEALRTIPAIVLRIIS